MTPFLWSTAAIKPLRMAEGDVDGDGFGDVIVAIGTTVAVFRGSAEGLASSPSTTLLASNVTGALAYEGVQSVALIGDVNGDGCSDFAAMMISSFLRTDISRFLSRRQWAFVPDAGTHSRNRRYRSVLVRTGLSSSADVGSK